MGWHLTSGREVAEWVAEKTSGFCGANSVGFGVKKDGELVCGASYDNWNGRSMFFNLVVEDRMTPTFLAAIFDYAFKVCCVEKLIVSICSGNKKAMGMAEKMGFEEESRITNAHPDGDFVFWTMTKEKCRFLTPKYGRKIVRKKIH